MCSNCIDNLRRHARLLRAPRQSVLLPGPRPTSAQLERHATRFGPEQVAETAAELGLSVTVERPRAPRKVRGPGLRERVAKLVAAGHGVEAIAEIEDLSPARARRLVEEIGT